MVVGSSIRDAIEMGRTFMPRQKQETAYQASGTPPSSRGIQLPVADAPPSCSVRQPGCVSGLAARSSDCALDLPMLIFMYIFVWVDSSAQLDYGLEEYMPISASELARI